MKISRRYRAPVHDEQNLASDIENVDDEVGRV